MKAEELECAIEARVGRGRWFTASDVGGLLSTHPHQRGTLIHRGALERRPMRWDDHRRIGSTHYEYRLT